MKLRRHYRERQAVHRGLGKVSFGRQFLVFVHYDIEMWREVIEVEHDNGVRRREQRWQVKGSVVPLDSRHQLAENTPFVLHLENGSTRMIDSLRWWDEAYDVRGEVTSRGWREACSLITVTSQDQDIPT